MSSTAVAGTSLMDRLGVAPTARAGRGNRERERDRHSPYARPKPNPDDDGPWKHDMYAHQNNIEGGTLGARLAVPEKAGLAGSVDTPLSLKKALAAVNGTTGKPFSIRGASGVTVEVRELVKGTTAADVEAIFKRCGKVLSAKLISPKGSRSDTETVQVKFETQDQAAKAIAMFHGQAADGRVLQVEMVNDGIALKGASGGIVSVDALLDDDSFGGSKMRSDAIMATDARAQVLTDPIGTRGQPRDGRARRQGGRGRGRRGRGMEVDS